MATLPQVMRVFRTHMRARFGRVPSFIICPLLRLCYCRTGKKKVHRLRRGAIESSVTWGSGENQTDAKRRILQLLSVTLTEL